MAETIITWGSKMVNDTDSEATPLVPKGSGSEVPRKGTILSSVFVLTTSCVGAGTLSVAYAFSQGGLAYSIGTFLVIMFSSVMAAMEMLDAKQLYDEMVKASWAKAVNINSFPALGEAALGIFGKVFTSAVIAILLFLSVIAYMIFSRDQLQQILVLIVEKAEHRGCVLDSIWTTRVVVMCFAYLPMSPMYLFRNLTPFKYISFASVLFIAFLVLSIMVEFFRKLADPNSDIHNMLTPEFGPSDPNSAIVCFTYLSLTLVCHFNILPLERELKRPTRLRIVLVNLITMFTAFGFYMIVGVFGYLQFLSHTNSDIALNYPADDYLMVVARALLFVAIVFHTPILFHPTRESLNIIITMACGCCSKAQTEEEEVTGEKEISLTHVNRSSNDLGRDRTPSKRLRQFVWACETWALFGAMFLPACFIPSVDLVWNFVGSMGGLLIVYILPPLYYLRIKFMHLRFRGQPGQPILSVWCNNDSHAGRLKDVIALAIMCLGVVSMIASNYTAIRAIVDAPGQQAMPPCRYWLNVTESFNITNITATY